jgi:hypothetical protein
MLIAYLIQPHREPFAFAIHSLEKFGVDEPPAWTPWRREFQNVRRSGLTRSALPPNRP